ncbi:MAG: hypothetical protein ACRDBP_03140 [Luteolibacter sp.]
MTTLSGSHQDEDPRPHSLLAHFKKHPAVSDVHVDLTRKVVLLEERKGKSITDKEITEHIEKSGFEPVKVERLKQRFDEAKAG